MTAPPTNRAAVAALFTRLVATEQALFRALARDGQALEWVLPLLEEEAAADRLGQWLPARDLALHWAFLGALEGVRRGGGVRSARDILRAAWPLRVTRKALLKLASGPCSGAVRQAVDTSLAMRNQVVEANQGLAQSCANRVLGRGGASGQAGLVDEGISEGMMALQVSVDRFQPGLGYAFSTFAMRGVEPAVRAVRTKWRGDVHLSGTARRRLKAILEEQSRVLRETGEMPGLMEVAEALGMKTAEVEDLLGASAWAVSLDEGGPEQGGGPSAISKAILRDGSDGLRQLRGGELQRALRAALDQLPEGQAEVLALRFGLEDGCPLSRAKVASKLGLTPTRVRALEKKGMKRVQPFLSHIKP